MYAADCRLYEVCFRGRNEGSCSSRIVLKGSRCHLGKMRSVGSACAIVPHGHWSSRTFLWACSRHKCAPGEAGFEVAQEASQQRAYSCSIRRRAFHGLQSPGLSYPSPRHRRS
jgi:hypothetical protein